jgi:spermidine synthase
MLKRVHVSEEKGVRYLHLGSPWVQGAMRIARPWSLELEYTRDMLVPLLMRSHGSWPARVLCVGLGSGSLPKFLYRHRPRSVITAVEISEEVIGVARQYFRLPDDERIRVVLGDAGEFVAKSEDLFDLILVDGFDGRGRAGPLDASHFHAHCRRLLAPGGLASVNLLTRQRGNAPSIARISEAYDNQVAVMAPSGDGNVIAIAGAEPLDLDEVELRERAVELKAASGLDLAPSIARLVHAKTRGI